MNYKTVVIGTTSFTYELLKRIHNKILSVDLIITISDDAALRNHISGFKSLNEYAKSQNISIFEAPDYYLNDEISNEFFSNNSFDIGICAGWQRKIPHNALVSSKNGWFGFHGSCGYLPFGRGRSPFNWSIINGDCRIIQNLFKYDDDFDSPNVFSKKMFEINQYDTIETIQYKSIITAVKQIEQLHNAYIAGCIDIDTETHDFNTWYEKRTPESGRIDFRLRTKDIYNLIRATSHPFPGAYVYNNKNIVKVWRAYPFDSILDFSMYKPGEVIEVIDNKPIIRTLDGSIIIEEYEGELINKGDVLI